MTDKTTEIAATLDKPSLDKITAQKQFSQKLRRYSAFSCEGFTENDFDIEKAVARCEQGFETLGAKGGLQEMVVAKMISLHLLQQRSIGSARTIKDINYSQYYANIAVKLSNAFVQQANLLTRLQGNGGHKIIVEHVDVHSGGQAIVGTVTSTPLKRDEK